MKFKDLKLGKKQFLGFVTILIIMAGVNIFSINKMAAIKSEIDEISLNWLPRAIAISDISLYASELRNNQLQHAFTSDGFVKQEHAQIMIALIDSINLNLDLYDKLKIESEKRNLYSQEEKIVFADFDQKWEAYHDLSFIFFRLLKNNEKEKAIRFLNNEALLVYNDFRQSLERLVSINKVDVFKSAERAGKTFRSTRRFQNILFVIAIILSVFFTATLVHYITVPVQQLENAARKVAENNLNVRLNINSKDEIGGLANSFNQMTTSLSEAKIKMEQQAYALQIKNNDLENAFIKLKNAQEQLMIKEKMAALGNLIAGIAHEINNPIGTINSSADVSDRCLKKINNEISKSKSLDELQNSQSLSRITKLLKNNLTVISTAGDRVATIVKSLKNFIRLDEAEYQKVDIHEGINSTLTLMENELKGRINVIKKFGDIPKVECYPSQLNQVFMNIIKNASQSITDSGEIIVKTLKGQNYVLIRISDTGIGIPKNKISNLFDFNFSVRDSRVKLGSGLATVYNIIQRHEGEIEVESKNNEGTVFSIFLPLK